MGQLEELENFLKIADAGGIGRAAEQTGLPKSAVSRRLADLEQRLGVQLLARTTRRWHLTEAGENCYQYALRLLETYEELRSNVSPNPQGLSGCLRISAPVSFGRLHLPKILHSFSLLHPDLELDVQLSDHRTNLIEEGIDIALRIGRLEDSRLRFRRLTPISMCLVASPDYLERAGYPEHPDDLSQHRLLKYNAVRDIQVILYGPNDEKFTVRSEGLFSSNNGDLITSMALLGCGITVGPRFICWRELAEGKLVKLLPEYRFHEAALHALYPTGRFTPMKVRLFIDHLVDEFRECAYWERD